jgi:hypothetical protein
MIAVRGTPSTSAHGVALISYPPYMYGDGMDLLPSLNCKTAGVRLRGNASRPRLPLMVVVPPETSEVSLLLEVLLLEAPNVIDTSRRSKYEVAKLSTKFDTAST